MKAATITEIKKELKQIPEEQLHEIILRMAKYKLENKELLHYLLFEADYEEGYISMAREEIEEGLADLHPNLYYAKKSIRKTLRITQKFIKYSKKKETEIALLMHFCSTLKDTGVSFSRSTALSNLYNRQIIKLEKAISGLHEDLQFDYQEEIDRLRL